MDLKEKLIDLLCQAHNLATDASAFDDATYAQQLEVEANHLIAHGVTVQECGHWNIIMDDYDCQMMQCSVCTSEFYDGDNDTVDCMHNYCPHCGANMMHQPPKGE